MHCSLRVLTALLCVSLFVPSAHAAGLKVSLTERALWPWPLESPKAFDVASRAEIAVFVEAMAESDARNDAPGDAVSVARWKDRMREVLVENFAKARETCADGALLCEGPVPGNWDALVSTAKGALGKLPAELAPWYAEQKPFHQGYLYEQVRLAGLFPKVTSEILPLAPSERFGLELPDRSFLLTFDDGPTPKGGGTDTLTTQLRAQGIHAAFFLLGSITRSAGSRPRWSSSRRSMRACASARTARSTARTPRGMVRLRAWSPSTPGSRRACPRASRS